MSDRTGRLVELDDSDAHWAGYRFAVIVEDHGDSFFVAGDPALSDQRFVRVAQCKIMGKRPPEDKP